MKMKMERMVLLNALESVQPGLAMNETISQSGSFIFQNGMVMTFNNSVACRAKSHLDPSFTGAVRAKAFIDLLRKLPDEVITLSVSASSLVINGIDKRAKLRMESEITIPLADLERPKKEDWFPVHEEFNDAVDIVQGVAGNDTSQFVGTCIHITPKWIEATDGFQLARYRLETGVKEPVLVRKDALKHVTSLEVTRIAETPKWLHFRNPAGVTLSILRQLDPYPDLKKNLKVEGTPAALPKGLDAAVSAASIFSKENADANLLIISLKKGKLMITGIGVSGEYSEIRDVNYSGPGMSFTIPPEILTRVATKHSDCVLTPKRLKVEGGPWCYVTSLGDPAAMIPNTDKQTEEAPKAQEEDSDEG